MAAEWTAARAVTVAEAAAMIGARFPALAPARVELLAAGWDNTVFVCNEDWVFRFPRREIAAPRTPPGT